MTVPNTISRVEYTGDGTSATFPVPFYFIAAADLVVILRDTAGVEHPQTLTSNYTTTGAGSEEGGAVVFLTAPPSGQAIVIYRDPPLTQDADYTPNGRFPAESHERALDRIVMQNQRTRELVVRSLRLSDGDSTASLFLPTIEQRRNKLFGFDVSGNMVPALGPSFVGDTWSSAARVASRGEATVTSFAATISTLRLEGYTTGGDGGGAVYKRVATQPTHAGKFRSADRILPNGTTDATNGGWWEISDAMVNAHQFGAIGDGTATDTTALQNAITYATSLGKTLYLLPGSYKTAALTVNRANGGGIVGLGRARIIPTANAVTLFTLTGAAQSTAQKTYRLQNLVVDGNGLTGVTFVSETLPFATIIEDIEAKQLAYGCVFTGGRNVTVRNVMQIGSACWVFRGDGSANAVLTRIFEVQISNFTQQYSGSTGGGVWGGPAFIDFYRAVNVMVSNILTESLDDQVDGMRIGGACEGIFVTNSTIVRPKIGYNFFFGADSMSPGWCYFTNTAADQPLTSSFDILGNNLFFTNINSTYGYFDSVPGGSVERQNTGYGFIVRSGTSNWHITNSHITQMARAGLWIEDGSSGGSVAGSTISFNNLIAGGGYADVINNVAAPFGVEFQRGNVIPTWGGNHPRRLIKGQSSDFLGTKLVNTQTGGDTTETALASYTLPAAVIDDGMIMEVKASGGFAANANTKTIRIRVGGQELAIATGAFNGSNWRFLGRLTRSGTNMLTEFVVFVGATVYATYNITSAPVYTGAILVSVTGQNGTASAGDIVNSSFDVRLVR